MDPSLPLCIVYWSSSSTTLDPLHELCNIVNQVPLIFGDMTRPICDRAFVIWGHGIRISTHRNGLKNVGAAEPDALSALSRHSSFRYI
jgi:hypothetical protein